MDQSFWIFEVIGIGAVFVVLFSIASYEFRKRIDPYKKIRQEIARQTGLKMVPKLGDPFALQGFTGNRLGTVFTMPFSRDRLKKYEVSNQNPKNLKLSIQSRNVPLAFDKFASLPATNLAPSTKPFFEQFEVYGKSTSFAFKIAENTILCEKLLGLTQYTKAIKFTVRKDRIVCYESGFRMASSDADEVIIGYLIFAVLVEIAKWVDSIPPKSI
ncbi:MAG: hypothetical protein H6654_10295 [Ardenticatenaceae bacterium]|nr:hypothetical protein [Ardenticatenaceae bacterium]MCB8973937.1 hypothetical protein [Ardenticatenaceae bacterium]